MVALLEARNVTKHGHYLGRHLGFNQELARFQVKTAGIDFLGAICKITHKEALCIILSTSFNFVERSSKNMA